MVKKEEIIKSLEQTINDVKNMPSEEFKQKWYAVEIESLKLQNAQLTNELNIAYKENNELRNRIKSLEKSINDFIVNESMINILETIRRVVSFGNENRYSMTNEEYLSTCTTEQLAEAIAKLVFKATGEFNRERTPSNRWFKKEYWLSWLQEQHDEMS